jgi:hypothetical protein
MSIIDGRGRCYAVHLLGWSCLDCLEYLNFLSWNQGSWDLFKVNKGWRGKGCKQTKVGLIAMSCGLMRGIFSV